MKHIRGVTLLELILVIVVIGAITAIGGELIVRATHNQQTQNSILNASWQARLGLFRMERELSDTPVILSASNNTISFMMDDGSTTTYAHDSNANTLTRNGNTLATDVSNVSFTYLGNSFNTLSSNPTLADIRCVGIQITITNSHNHLPLQTVVCPRSLE